MRILVFLAWGLVALMIVSTIGCAVGSIWADGDKTLGKNLSDTAWLGFLLSLASTIGMGIATGVLHEEGKI